MLNAVRSDRTGVALGMNPVDIQALPSSGGFEVVETASSAYPLGVNVTQAPFDTKEARQAVQYALDRERIASQIFGDAARATDLFWEPGTPGYPEDLEDYYTYDPKKATTMLEKAGASGAAIEITVIGLPQSTGAAEIIRNNLEAVGLTPTIVVQEPQTWDQNQVVGELGQAFLPLHGLNGLGPDTLLNVLPSLRQGNPSKFWTDEYMRLRNDLATATEDGYADALHDLTEYILDEAFTSVVVQSTGQVVEAGTVHDTSFTSRGYLYAGNAFVED